MASTPTDCRRCWNYSDRDKWCRAKEQKVRNPTLGKCVAFEGVMPSEKEEDIEE